MALEQARQITNAEPFKICFVCLGNICRSPTAEGIFQDLVNKRELQSYFEVDSAGTSAYHLGETADENAQKIARKNDVELLSKARRLESFDLDYFDLIVAMDLENYSNIKELDKTKEDRDKIVLMRVFDPEPDDKEVPDPYFGGIEGFENVFDILHRSCDNLLDELSKKIAE